MILQWSPGGNLRTRTLVVSASMASDAIRMKFCEEASGCSFSSCGISENENSTSVDGCLPSRETRGWRAPVNRGWRSRSLAFASGRSEALVHPVLIPVLSPQAFHTTLAFPECPCFWFGNMPVIECRCPFPTSIGAVLSVAPQVSDLVVISR